MGKVLWGLAAVIAAVAALGWVGMRANNRRLPRPAPPQHGTVQLTTATGAALYSSAAYTMYANGIVLDYTMRRPLASVPVNAHAITTNDVCSNPTLAGVVAHGAGVEVRIHQPDGTLADDTTVFPGSCQ